MSGRCEGVFVGVGVGKGGNVCHVCRVAWGIPFHLVAWMLGCQILGHTCQPVDFLADLPDTDCTHAHTPTYTHK